MFGSYIRGRRIDPYRPLELPARARIAGSAQEPVRGGRRARALVPDGRRLRLQPAPAAGPGRRPAARRLRHAHARGLLPALRRRDGADAPLPRASPRASPPASPAAATTSTRATGPSPTTTRTRGSRSGSAAGAGCRSTRPRAAAGLAGAYSSSSPQFDAAAAVAVLAGKDGLGSFAKHRSAARLRRAALDTRARRPARRPSRPTPSHGWRAPGIVGLLALVLAVCIIAIALAKTVIRRSRYLTRDPRRLAVASAKELRDILRDQLVPVPASATLLELAAARRGRARREGGAASGCTRPSRGSAAAASAGRAADELQRDLRALRRGIRSRLTRLERLRGLLSLRSLGTGGHRDERHLRALPAGPRPSQARHGRPGDGRAREGEGAASPRRRRSARRSGSRTSGSTATREAESEFRKVLELAPVDDYAHYALGRCLEKQGRDSRGERPLQARELAPRRVERDLRARGSES